MRSHLDHSKLKKFWFDGEAWGASSSTERDHQRCPWSVHSSVSIKRWRSSVDLLDLSAQRPDTIGKLKHAASPHFRSRPKKQQPVMQHIGEGRLTLLLEAGRHSQKAPLMKAKQLNRVLPCSQNVCWQVGM